jgi:hypothetical protein
MKTILLLSLLLVPSIAYSQNPVATASQKFGWDQDIAEGENVPALVFKYYADGSTTGVVFTGVICGGTAPTLSCTVPIPAFTPGNHSIRISASNIAGESALSVPFDFALIVVPAAPRAIRIVN